MKEMRKRKNKEKAKGWNEKTNQGNGNKHKEQNEQIRVIRKLVIRAERRTHEKPRRNETDEGRKGNKEERRGGRGYETRKANEEGSMEKNEIDKGDKERTRTWEPTCINLSICSDLSEFLSDHCCAPRSVTSHTRSVKKLKETHFSRLDTNVDNPS